MGLRYTSIYSDTNGLSHFRDLEFEVNPRIIGPMIPPLGATPNYAAETGYFLTFPPGIAMDWHPAPRRLYHFFLAGECEVAVSDGEVRTFRSGDIVLAEDTIGAGHKTSNPGSEVTLMAVVGLPD